MAIKLTMLNNRSLAESNEDILTVLELSIESDIVNENIIH